MKKLLIIILALSLYSCTTNKYVAEETQIDCIHTGIYLTEKGDTMPYTVVYDYHNCAVCKGISDYIGEAK
jgi:hypothetical protein